MKAKENRRREVLLHVCAASATAALPPWAAALVPSGAAAPQRVIPSSGERIPAIGMGSWLTFDIADTNNAAVQADRRREVLRIFFSRGGALIDTSPMYGSSEQVIGELLRPDGNAVEGRERVFAATKVWTMGEAAGRAQMEDSITLWRAGQMALPGRQVFDLIQIHNMLDWQTHLKTLKVWKAAGRVRYVGITTSHGRRHDALEAAMRRERFDFVQFTCNLADRTAEARLLPLAQDLGAAVIINRPFDGGALFRKVRAMRLPPWAGEIGCATWADYFLKFVISHPAVTCAIPATSAPQHMAENMQALAGPLPDQEMRRRMAAHWDTI